MLFWFMKIISFIPFWLFCPAIIKNSKKIPKGKCVLVLNHKSNYDPLIILNMLWRNQHVLSKKELFEKPFSRAFFKGMKAIPVNREKVEISTIKQCLEVLKNNEILTVFPEGTRNQTDEPLLEIKGGAGIFAAKTNAPIVPIWFVKKPKPFRINKLVVGEPFYITKDELSNGDEIIKQKLLELRSEVINKK